MVVPFGAGGAVDAMARIIAPRLSQLLGQQVVIENIGGAGGMTGAARIARAPPDGYQFIYGNTGTHAINQTLYKTPLYNAATDFAPVSVTAHAFFTLITRKDLPTAPNSSPMRRPTSRSAIRLGRRRIWNPLVAAPTWRWARISPVPYRSTAIAMGLMASRIDFICEPVITALPQIAGTVKASLFWGERSPALPISRPPPSRACRSSHRPGTPFCQRRYTRRSSSGWPTPPSNDRYPAVRQRYLEVGLRIPPPEQRSTEYLTRLVPADIEKWAGPIKASGMSVE
jgi:hypothetical protein